MLIFRGVQLLGFTVKREVLIGSKSQGRLEDVSGWTTNPRSLLVAFRRAWEADVEPEDLAANASVFFRTKNPQESCIAGKTKVTHICIDSKHWTILDQNSHEIFHENMAGFGVSLPQGKVWKRP